MWPLTKYALPPNAKNMHENPFYYLSDCYLQLKVEDKTKLTLDSLRNPKTDNTGLNCTVFIVPKKNFGLEINLSSLSVYGMRDICKGRYLQFTKQIRVPSSLVSYPLYSTFDSKSGSSSSAISIGKNSNANVGGDGESSNSNSEQSSASTSKQMYLANNNFLENVPRAPTHFDEKMEAQEEQQQQFAPLVRKFCGKLEDYSENERTLTFLSSESALLSASSYNSQQEGLDNDVVAFSENRAPVNNPKVWGINLTVRLPVAVKAREVFAFDLTALSPCQRVTLNGLDGQLKYSKHYENDQCSVVIHVPYGNIILAQIAVNSNSDHKAGDSDIDSNRGLVTTGEGAPSVNHRANNVVQRDFITSAANVEEVVLTTNNDGKSESRESQSETPEDVTSSGVLSRESTDNKSSGVTNKFNRVDSVSISSPQNATPTSTSNSKDDITNYTTGYSAQGGNVGSRQNDVIETSYHESQLELYDNGDDILDNSIPISPPSVPSSSYECPDLSTKQREMESNGINDVNSSNNVNSGDSGSGDGSGSSTSGSKDNASRKQQLKQHKYLLIQAVDLVSGSEFNWCFDALKQNSAHKRAWKSSGNRVSVNFRMSHFDTFILTYQSVKIPELTGDCERGWVKLDGACVTVMERTMKWTDAEESCQMKGGHLATVKNDLNEGKLGKLIAER